MLVRTKTGRGLELENQRGLAISSERGCLPPGLCRNSRNDVTSVWSESRKAVSCSVCLRLLRLTCTTRTGGSNVNSFDGRCTSKESASGELDAVGVVLC